MLLPNNGRIIIIDDKENQALPLLKALSRNKIAATYHSEKIEDLPETPYEDLRVLFLDINLTDSLESKDITGVLINILKRIIVSGSPYILAIWSVKEDLVEIVEGLFETELKDKKPIIQIRLSKNDFFDYDPEEGRYIPINESTIVHDINKRLEERFSGVDAFEAIIKWETIVNESCSQIIKEYSNLIKFDENWNNNFKHVLYKMSHAQLGQNLKEINDKGLITTALKTFNNSFVDKVEEKLSLLNFNYLKISNETSYIKKIKDSELKITWIDEMKYDLQISGKSYKKNKIIDFKKCGTNEEERNKINLFLEEYMAIAPEINTKLLIDLSPLKGVHPGNVYYKFVKEKKKRELLATYFGQEAINKKKDDGNYCYDVSGIRFLEMEVSPICDYAQKKWLKHRFVSGIIYPIEFSEIFNKHSALNLYAVGPTFKINNQLCKIILNFHLLKAKDISSKEVKFIKPKFKFKNELFVDILSRLSSHASRSGVVFIE